MRASQQLQLYTKGCLDPITAYVNGSPEPPPIRIFPQRSK